MNAAYLRLQGTSPGLQPVSHASGEPRWRASCACPHPQLFVRRVKFIGARPRAGCCGWAKAICWDRHCRRAHVLSAFEKHHPGCKCSVAGVTGCPINVQAPGDAPCPRFTGSVILPAYRRAIPVVILGVLQASSGTFIGFEIPRPYQPGTMLLPPRGNVRHC